MNEDEMSVRRNLEAKFHPVKCVFFNEAGETVASFAISGYLDEINCDGSIVITRGCGDSLAYSLKKEG